MGIFFIFILGLIFGSFINAMIYRLHIEKSFVWSRSMCPWCKHGLIWYELIPVFSFFYQKGKCNYCHKKISWQYPIVELVVGLIFIIIYLQVVDINSLAVVTTNEFINVIGYFIIVIFLIIIFIYDLKFYLILDKISVPAMAFAIIWNLSKDFSLSNLVNLLVAGLVAGGFFLLQYVVSKGKWIGGGDIRLGFLMGFVLGWPNVIVGLMLSYFIGAFFSIFMLFLKKKKWGSKIPFGTFLTIGTFIALFWSKQLIIWYLNWLS